MSGFCMGRQMAFRSLGLGPAGHKWDPLCSGSALQLFEFGLSFTEFIKYVLFFFNSSNTLIQ